MGCSVLIFALHKFLYFASGKLSQMSLFEVFSMAAIPTVSFPEIAAIKILPKIISIVACLSFMLNPYTHCPPKFFLSIWRNFSLLGGIWKLLP